MACYFALNVVSNLTSWIMILIHKNIEYLITFPFASEKSMSKILYFFLGLLSAIFTPLIVDTVKKYLNRNKLKKSFGIELDDVRERLVFVVFKIVSKFGKYDRELLTWVSSNIKDSFEIHNISGEKFSEVIERLSKLSDQDLKNIDANQKTVEGRGLSLKKINLPLVDSKLDSLSLFDLEFQRKLLDIRIQINFMNEEIEQARFYHRLTFDSGISNENHQLIVQNYTDSNLHISQIAKSIVQKIDSFIQD